MERVDPDAIEGVDVEAMGRYLATTEVTYAVLFGSRVIGNQSSDSDVDVGIRFPERLEKTDRFRCRNRIDAHLQSFAAGFVDVSDIQSLPPTVAYRALRDGRLLYGDESAAEADFAAIEREYEATAKRRKRDRTEFLDELARGDA